MPQRPEAAGVRPATHVLRPGFVRCLSGTDAVASRSIFQGGSHVRIRFRHASHAGARPDPATGARQVPIYQTTAYVFRDADHAAALFNLQEVGYIYSRLTNPTVAALGERLAALEGGVGAVCTSSGHAAQIMALYPLMMPGCNIVAFF